MPRRKYIPSPDEDNKLFLATGFRYLPARERGFPHPWCAKRTRKGWVVRDSPHMSPSDKQPDTGVQFLGWKEADKMFRSREILIQRAHQSQSKNKNGTIIQNQLETVISSDSPTKQTSNIAKVDQWFRNTHSAVQRQKREAVEAEFQLFLKKKRKQYALEVKQERQNERKKKKEQRGRKRDSPAKSKTEVPEVPSSSSINQTSDETQLPMSPTRRKHKRMTPKRNPNSVTLGEDPDLDEMIEDIVLEFTREYSSHRQDSSKKAGGVNFDGSAVSALREAAKETLLQQGTPSAVATSAKICATSSKASDASCTSNDGIVNKENQHQKEDGSEPDERITGMIEQLIGEVAQDSGCQFDGSAVEALKEAVKEIDSSNII